MIYGIGTDIVLITRIDKILKKHGKKFVDKVLFKNEFIQYQKTVNKSCFVAKRFAAKEAFAKAIGTGISGFWFNDVEITNDKLGKPNIITHGKCRKIVASLQVDKVHLSLSDEDNYAIAFVIVECCQ